MNEQYNHIGEGGLLSFGRAVSLEARRKKDAMLDGVVYAAPKSIERLSLSSYCDEVMAQDTSPPALHDLAKSCVTAADEERIATLIAQGVMGLIPCLRSGPRTGPHELAIVSLNADGTWGDLGFLGAYLPEEVVSNVVKLPRDASESRMLYVPLMRACDDLCKMIWGKYVVEGSADDVEAMLDVFRERLR